MAEHSEAAKLLSPVPSTVPDDAGNKGVPDAVSSNGPTDNSPNLEKPPAPSQSSANLEERLARLETALSAVADTRQLEERIVRRVYSRLDRKRVAADKDSAKTGAEAPPRAQPALAPIAHVVAPPVAALIADKAPSSRRGMLDSVTPASARRTWQFFSVLQDLRSIWQMLRDRRYRMSWLGKTLPIALLVLLISQWINLWGWIPLLGPMMNQIVALLTSFIILCMVFKVLQREVETYRKEQ